MQKEITFNEETWEEKSPNGEPIILHDMNDKSYKVHSDSLGTKVDNLGIMHTMILIYKNKYEIKTNMCYRIIKDDFIINKNKIHIDLEILAKYDILDLVYSKLISLNDTIAHINFSMCGFLSSTHGAAFDCKMGDVIINHITPINNTNNTCIMKLKADYTISE